MNLSDLIVSYIRTYVPIGLGVALTYLGKHLGIVEPDPGTIAWVTGAVVAGYYTLARFAESKVPALGFLLGSTKQPTYDKAE